MKRETETKLEEIVSTVKDGYSEVVGIGKGLDDGVTKG